MAKRKNIFLTVVIPCYNEVNNLERGVLLQVHKYLSEKKFDWEVIISDDGSTDKSRQLVKGQIKDWKNFKLLENAHGGKPVALMSGIDASRGKYILFTDMDLSTPIGELDKLLPWAKKGFDAIIGSRGHTRKNFPFYRKFGAVVFIWLRKAVVLSHIDDTQCGFKLFKKDLLKEAFPKLEYIRNKRKVKGWKVTSYDVELLHIIDKMGGKIKEVRVAWDDKDTSGSKGGALPRYFRESLDMVKQIVRVKINDISGLYDVR